MRPEDRDKFAERWLDAALKQRGEAEPAPGLEQRILSTLRERGAQERWQWRWWWPAFNTVAAVILFGTLVLVVRDHPREAPRLAGQTPATSRQTPSGAQQVPPLRKLETSAAKTPARVRVKRGVASAVPDRGPRLEQFPSPQPLSEQEQLLARYVSEFHDEGVMIAKMQAEQRIQDELEGRRLQQGTDTPSSTDKQE